MALYGRFPKKLIRKAPVDSRSFGNNTSTQNSSTGTVISFPDRTDYVKQSVPREKGRSCPISFFSCHCEAAQQPWQSVLLKVFVFLKARFKSEHFGERIATPACAGVAMTGFSAVSRIPRILRSGAFLWVTQASFALAAAIISTHSSAIRLSSSVRFSSGARTPPMSGPPVSRRISLIMAYILPLPEHIL